MNKLSFLLIFTILLGCQSKAPVAKGNWEQINPIGFIPQNITVYSAETVKRDAIRVTEYRDTKAIKQEQKQQALLEKQKQAEQAKQDEILRKRQLLEKKQLEKEMKQQFQQDKARQKALEKQAKQLKKQVKTGEK